MRRHPSKNLKLFFPLLINPLVEEPLSIIVRKATSKDLETLLNIERECFTLEAFTEKQMSYLLKSPNSVSLVAKVNDEVAGFTIGLIERHGKTKRGHVYTIDVAAKHRRMGIGLKLLGELERIFVEKGVETCYLEARVDNRAARELYRKHGYIELEPLENFYSIGVHGIRLKKEL